jgi:hypothetical protein
MNPLIIIGCIQAAVAVAGMLSPKGPDLSDLINIQMQMLRNISNQIAKLQEGIIIIIQDIDNLKIYVQYELPSDIYKGFVKNELIAYFSQYERDINTYFEERKTKGIYKSLERNRDILTRTLFEIQHKRDQILDVKDYFLTPIIARCFKIEMDLLIVLFGDDNNDISSAYFRNSLKGYENWLRDMQNPNNSYSVDNSINKFKQAIDLADTNSYGFRMCKVAQEKVREDENGFGYSDTYTFDLNVEYFSFKRVLNPEIEQQMVAKEISFQQLAQIYNDLQIDPKYIPNIISQTVELKIKDEPLEVKLFDEFMNAIPGDGMPASQSFGQFNDPRFDVNRHFLFALNKCDNPSQQILTNKKYPDSAKNIDENGKKIIIPITHKKIMFDIQNKINTLKTII